MLESLPVTLVLSTALGFLSGLGIGGGSLLILWLTLLLGWDAGSAAWVNLVFFLPSALASTCLRRKRGVGPGKEILPAILSGCVCALFFSLLRLHIDTRILKKLFGLLLLATGAKEVLWKKKP